MRLVCATRSPKPYRSIAYQGKKETARNDTWAGVDPGLPVCMKTGCRSWQGRQGKFADLEHEGFGQVISLIQWLVPSVWCL